MARKTNSHTLALLVVAVLAFAISGCSAIDSARDWLQETVVGFIPPSVDVSLGKKSLPEVLHGQDVVDDPVVTKILAKLLSPLTSIAKQDLDVPYQVYVTSDPIVNAFALPGGPIILPAGFLLFVKDQTEIQGVYAHELAHISERHTMQRLVAVVGLAVAIALITEEAGDLGTFAAEVGGRLLAKEYSRDHEGEADALGFSYLMRAGVNPGGLTAFFARLAEKRKSPDKLKSLQRLMSTHPLTEDRVEALRLLPAASDQFEPTITDQEFKQLQKRLKRHVKAS